MRRRFPVILLAALAVAGCTGHGAVTQGVGGGSGFQTSTDPALFWYDAGDRTTVSGVSGRLLDGQPFDLDAWRGHVVVVNFWSSDCTPCRDEAQSLEAVYRQDRDRGVRFLGIDVRDDAASARSFAAAHHVTYPSLEDPGGVQGLRFGLGPDATPTTFVLDRSGGIAARHSGAILFSTLRAVVRKAIAEPAAT